MKHIILHILLFTLTMSPFQMVSAKNATSTPLSPTDKDLEVQQIRANHERARKNYEVRKSAFQQATQKAQSTRDAFIQARNRFINTKDSAVREDYLVKAKEHILNIFDKATSHLHQLQAKINDSTVISTERKTKLLSQIESRIAAIVQLRAVANGTTDPTQFKHIAKQLRIEWKKSQLVLHRASGKFLSYRLSQFLDQVITTPTRIQARIDSLSAEGKNVDSIKRALTELNSAIANATTALDSAEKIFDGIDSESEDPLSDFNEGMIMLREAFIHIKSAYDALQKAIRAIRAISSSTIKPPIVKKDITDAALEDETESARKEK